MPRNYWGVADVLLCGEFGVVGEVGVAESDGLGLVLPRLPLRERFALPLLVGEPVWPVVSGAPVGVPLFVVGIVGSTGEGEGLLLG